MPRICSSVFVCITLLAGRGISQPVPNVTDTARADLAKEWRDRTIRTPVKAPPHVPPSGSGAFYCLTAFDLLTRSGANDPARDREDALEDLIAGDPASERVYKAVPKEDLERLLVPDRIDISKDNAQIAAWFFDYAKANIISAISKDPTGFKTAVYEPYTMKDLPRALFGLLNLEMPALKAQIDLFSEQKKVEEGIAQAQNAIQQATERMKQAQAHLEAANNNAKSAAGQKQSNAEVSAAQGEVDAANRQLQAAQHDLQGYSDKRDRNKAALTPTDKAALDAVDLMEIYRICYALDKDRFFKIVADQYAPPAN